MSQEIRDIRRLYDIREVLQRAGVDTRKRWLICPLPDHPHKNYSPSFSIYVGTDGVERFKCHGVCGAQGDVIDLAGYMWIPGYDPQQVGYVSKAIDVLQMKVPLNLSFRNKTPEPQLYPDTFWEYLPISDIGKEYFHTRGLDDQTIKEFYLGSGDTFVTIPTFEADQLVALKKRSLTGTGKFRFWMESGSRKALFNYDEVVYAQGPVFYVKAEIPAMLLHQHRYKACAPTTGEGGFLDDWRIALAFADVIVVGDNDETGRETATQRGKDIPNSCVRFPPEPYKDIDEWILAEGEAAWELIHTWTMSPSQGSW